MSDLFSRDRQPGDHRQREGLADGGQRRPPLHQSRLGSHQQRQHPDTLQLEKRQCPAWPECPRGRSDQGGDLQSCLR